MDRMAQELEIMLEWDEVAGEYTGHIVGLPEAPIHGGQKREQFIANARAMIERFGYAGRPIKFTNSRHETLDLAA